MSGKHRNRHTGNRARIHRYKRQTVNKPETTNYTEREELENSTGLTLGNIVPRESIEYYFPNVIPTHFGAYEAICNAF